MTSYLPADICINNLCFKGSDVWQFSVILLIGNGWNYVEIELSEMNKRTKRANILVLLNT